MRTCTFVGFFISALTVPLFVGAATPQELEAQIVELLNKVQGLQQQIGGINSIDGMNTVSNTATPINSASVQCPHVSRVLKRGATGQDVSRLQQFLALDPTVYPEAQVTGFYGALTEAAVKRFQCKNKLVCDGTPESTGYGVTGPRTAALMALQCPDVQGGGSQVGGFVRVSPIQGTAPLLVTIEATVNTTKSCTGATYEIDYGDNSPKTIINVPGNSCNEMRQVLSHTYSSPGTFTVTLRSGTQQVHATVTVGGGGAQVPPGIVDSLSVTPQSGVAPFTATFKGTFNASGACSLNTYTLDFGDGQTTQLTPSGCSPSLVTVTHTYESSGSFIARLIRDAGNVQMGNVTISVSGGTVEDTTTNYGSYFSVAPGISGDVFTVLADFEVASPCTAFQLNWGDGTAQVTQQQGTCSQGVVSKQYEHIYSNAGSYTVTLKRGANLSETHTAGITISN